MTDKNKPCSICQQTEKLTKPYGPGRALICFKCADSDPERRIIAAMYEKEALDAAKERIRAAMTEMLQTQMPGMKVKVMELTPNGIAEALDDPDFRAYLANTGLLPDDTTCDCPKCTARRNQQQVSLN